MYRVEMYLHCNKDFLLFCVYMCLHCTCSAQNNSIIYCVEMYLQCTCSVQKTVLSTVKICPYSVPVVYRQLFFCSVKMYLRLEEDCRYRILHYVL